MEFQTSSSFLQITQTECRTFLLKKYEGKKKICGCFAQNKTKVLAPLSIIAEGHQIKFNKSYLSSIRLFPNSDLALAKCGAFSIEV